MITCLVSRGTARPNTTNTSVLGGAFTLANATNSTLSGRAFNSTNSTLSGRAFNSTNGTLPRKVESAGDGFKYDKERLVLRSSLMKRSPQQSKKERNLLRNVCYKRNSTTEYKGYSTVECKVFTKFGCGGYGLCRSIKTWISSIGKLVITDCACVVPY